MHVCSTSLSIVDFFICIGFGCVRLGIPFDWIILVVELMCKKLKHLVRGMEFLNGAEEVEW